MSDALRAGLVDKLTDCALRLDELDAIRGGRDNPEGEHDTIDSSLASVLRSYVLMESRSRKPSTKREHRQHWERIVDLSANATMLGYTAREAADQDLAGMSVSPRSNKGR